VLENDNRDGGLAKLDLEEKAGIAELVDADV
jgi:hypothetical protein